MAVTTGTEITKIDGVRRALDELGHDAMPQDIQAYVKKEFGLKMTTAHVSNYKTNILRKRSGKHASKRAMVKKSADHKTLTIFKDGKTLSFGDIEAVKGLVGRVGGETLLGLIDLLGK